MKYLMEAFETKLRKRRGSANPTNRLIMLRLHFTGYAKSRGCISYSVLQLLLKTLKNI
jgi:hypothetical protein